MPAGECFRVIDYKSGSVPSSTQVKQGEMLQLPLFHGCEELLFASEGTELHDIGYWSLKKDGFKSITFESWVRHQDLLVAHVLALIDRLRRGVFVVQSRKPGCETYCKYRGVCRIRQVRQAEKRLDLLAGAERPVAAEPRQPQLSPGATAGARSDAAERPPSSPEAD